MVSIVASRQLTNNFVISISSHSLGPRLSVAWDTCQLEDFKYSMFGTHILFFRYAVSSILFVLELCSMLQQEFQQLILWLAKTSCFSNFPSPPYNIGLWTNSWDFLLVKFAVCKILEVHPPLETILRGQASSQNLLTLLGFKTYLEKFSSITFISDSNPHSLCFPFIAVNCYRKIGWQISLSVSLDYRCRLVSPQILP